MLAINNLKLDAYVNMGELLELKHYLKRTPV